MEKLPSLESKAMGTKPGPSASRPASPATVTARPATGTASSRHGQLSIACTTAASADPPSEKDGSVDGGGLKTKSCKRKIGIQVSPKEKTKKGREESSHKNLLQNLLVKKQQKYPVYITRSEGEPDCKFWCIVEVHGQQFKSVNLHIHKKDAEQDAAKVAYDFLIARDGDSFEGVLALIDKGLLLGKTILYDFSCKKKICHPSYSCHRQEGPGRMTLFVTTVSVAGMEFTGVMAKSKNDAAERAACLAVKSILDTNDEVMLKIFRTKRRLLTAMPPSLLSACGLSVPAKHSPKKHKTNALGVSKDAYVEEPDEVQDNKRPRHEQFGRESTISGTSYQQPQTYMFQSSTVTYDCSDGALYTSSTTRSGGDEVTMEEIREADIATGKATTQRIAHGIGNKGHALTRKLDCDGKVNTMEASQNINEDELAGFEESCQRNAGQCLPGSDSKVNMLSSAPTEMFASPAAEQYQYPQG